MNPRRSSETVPAQVMIVTGGGRGIGAATALLAAARGDAVCVNHLRDRARAEAVVERIASAGGRAVAVAADVASEPEVAGLFEAVDRDRERVERR